MQSIFGALLTAGYAAAVSAQIGASGKDVTSSTQAAAHEIVRQRRGGRAATPPVLGRDHRRREAGVPRRRRLGIHGRSRRDRCSVRFSSSSCSRSTRRRSSSSLRTTRRTPQSPSGDLERRVPAPPLPAREPVGGSARRRRSRLGRSASRRPTSARSSTSARAGSTRRTTAESVLAAVVAASVGLVGFVVTVSVLIVQMATGTFSARYMRIFYRDWAFKAVLARAHRHVHVLVHAPAARRGGTPSRTSASPSPGRSSGCGILLFVIFLDRAIHRLRPVAVAALVAKAGRRALRQVLAERGESRMRRRSFPLRTTRAGRAVARRRA